MEQFLKEGHLRWDSLGEYLAVAVSFEHLSETTKNPVAGKLARSLNKVSYVVHLFTTVCVCYVLSILSPVSVHCRRSSACWRTASPPAAR